jgi:hypothetical protein
MSGKYFLSFALVLVPLGAGVCRADFEDRLLAKVRQRRQAEAEDLRREVTSALARVPDLTLSAPEEALKLLQTSLGHLQKDELLPRAEHRALRRQVEEQLHNVKQRITAQEAAAAKARPQESFAYNDRPRRLDGPRLIRPRVPEAPHPGALRQADAPRVGGQVSDNPPLPSYPTGGRGRFVRLSFSGTFIGGPPFFAFGTTTAVVVPDGGTASVGGYSRMLEGRNEFGPPGLSNIPYAGRLFRNIGYGREPRSIRLLASVRVFSMAEEEERFLAQEGAK